MINVFQPSLGEEEIAMLRQVFQSNWIGRGKMALEFESKFAECLGVYRDQCLSISSCTEGLYLAAQMIDLQEGDEVILPSISFIGAGEAVAAAGGIPVFCDVHPATLNPTLAHIKSAYREGYTKAIILLHYGGFPCNEIWEIANFAKERKITLIEDSACSIAARSRNKACGTIGDIGVWSFDAMKILSTGDGGMMYFKDRDMKIKAESMAWLYTTSKSGLSSDFDEWWQVNIDGVGRRMLMNDITAAIGLVQLEKLPGFIKRRQELFKLYDACLSDVRWVSRPPMRHWYETPCYYFYWIKTPDSETRNALAKYLRDMGIYTTFRYWPLHKIPYFIDHYHYNWASPPKLPGAEQAAERTLNLPMHQALTDDEVRYICQTIKQFGEEHNVKAL